MASRPVMASTSRATGVSRRLGEFALPLPFLAQPAWRLAGMAPFLAGCAIVLGLGVIRREESYLERKFADEYRAYKARVGRWL